MGVSEYIWRSRDDGRVRALHQDRDDHIWTAPLEDCARGKAVGCRCSAEQVFVLEDLPEGATFPKVAGGISALVGLTARNFMVRIGAGRRGNGARLWNRPLHLVVLDLHTPSRGGAWRSGAQIPDRLEKCLHCRHNRSQ